MYEILTERVGAIPDIDYQYDWVRFLPSVKVKISPSRVRVCRLNYKSPILRSLQGDPVAMKTGMLRVYYDPFDLRITWCFDAEGVLHLLRWQYLTEGTPRFGEFHTSHIVDQHADKKISSQEIERILVQIFTGVYDNGEALEAIRHADLADDLMRRNAAHLTAGIAETSPSGTVILAPAPVEQDDRTDGLLRARAATPPVEVAVQSPSSHRPAEISVASPGEHRREAEAGTVAEPPGTPPPRARRALQPYARNRF
nr:Mu transposase C-terminal domain-containing protein [Leifsonia sp. C5G2]